MKILSQALTFLCTSANQVYTALRIQVCPKKGIIPTFLFFSDRIGTLIPIRSGGVRGFLGLYTKLGLQVARTCPRLQICPVYIFGNKPPQMVPIDLNIEYWFPGFGGLIQGQIYNPETSSKPPHLSSTMILGPGILLIWTQIPIITQEGL